MNDIQPFRIAIEDSELDDLRSRIERTRWANESPAPSLGTRRLGVNDR